MNDKSLLRQVMNARQSNTVQDTTNDKSLLRRSLEAKDNIAKGIVPQPTAVTPQPVRLPSMVQQDALAINRNRSRFGMPQLDNPVGLKEYAPVTLESLAGGTPAPEAPAYVSPFAKNEDYAELSQYKSTRKDIGGKKPLLSFMLPGQSKSSEYEDKWYEYVNRNPEIVDLTDADLAKMGASFSGANRSYLKQMTDEQIADYNYVYATQGKEEADKFLDSLQKDLTAKQNEKFVERTQEYAREHPVASSAASVIAGPAKGLSLVGQLAEYADTGDIDPNSMSNRFVQQNQTIRETVPENWGKVGQFLYGTGMSVLDNLYNMALTGAFGNIGGLGEGAQSLILGIMGSSAAADSTLTALENGYSADRALIQGAIAGGIEALTEKVSLEALLSPNAFKDGTIKYLLKNMAAEGSEEGASTISNWVVDWIGDLITDENRSDFRQVFTAFKRGDTKEGWRKIGEMGLDLAQDVAGGALSGGVLAGGGSLINLAENTVAGRSANRNYSSGDILDYVKGSMADVQDNPYASDFQRNLANTAMEQYEQNGKVSNHTLGELMQSNAYLESEQAASNNLLGEAMEQINSGKTVSDSTVSQILKDQRAVDYLSKNSGLQLQENMTRPERFQAVRNSLDQTIQQIDEVQAPVRRIQTEINQKTDMVSQFAKTLGKEGGRTLSRMAAGENLENISNLAGAYTRAYNEIKANPEVNLNEVTANSDYSLTPRQLNDVYKAAVADRETDIRVNGPEYEDLSNGTENTEKSDGGRPEWKAGLAAGVTTERLENRTGESSIRPEAAEIQRNSERNQAAVSSVEAVTPKQAGIPGGINTEASKTIKVVSEDKWAALDTDTYNYLKSLKDRGFKVVAWTGRALAYDDMSGTVEAVRGFHDGKTIGVRVDATLSARQIGMHEEFHDMVRANSDVQKQMVRKLSEKYTDQQIDTIIRDYVEQYGWTDANEEDILNEILADAYAGIDIFNRYLMNYEGASRFTEDVRGMTGSGIESDANGTRAGPAFSRDAENKYLEAIKSGDTDTAQQIVDEAAKEAGYTIKAYHGTTENFNSFSRNKQGTNHDGYLEFGAGFYFTPNADEAREWVRRGRSGQSGKAAAKVMSVYLNPGRIIGADDAIPEAVSSLQTMGLAKAEASFVSNRTYRFINYLLEEKGFTNTEVQETLKGFGYDAIDASYGSAIGKPSGQYVVFDPEQIKSADPVTYDDNGEPISLSGRFNAGKNDIRYSRDKWQMDGQMSLSDLEGYYQEKYENVSEENIKTAAKETKGIIERIQNFQDKEVRNKSGKRVLGNVRTVALGITSEFVKTGYIDFGGLKLSKNPSKAAAQIASYAMILRNPNFETFRILYTKGNRIVGNSAVTSYNVDTSYAALDKDMDTSNGMIRDQMKRLGADGYYLMHNHPSGSVNYSNADKQMTDYYRKTIAGFKGHIIIDHNQYGFFDASPDMKYSVNDIENGNAKDIHSRRINSPLLYRVINGPESLADIAQDVVHNNDISTLIYAHKDGIRAIQEVNNKFLLSKDFKNYVNNRKLDFGSVQTFLVTNMKTFNEVDRSNLFSTGLFTDVVGDGETDELFGKSFYSLHELGRGQWGTVKEAGLYRVYEEDNGAPTQYSRDTTYMDSEGSELSKEQAEYFKDSKIRDEDGNLQIVYHGTDADFTVFDRTKGRSNMDIQGSFFSPWDIDAGGYGSNVQAYYLNITNPAPESVAYKALNRFKGQNNAGVKAREYLESLGYDGVNNSDEEYIAFNPEQIKRVDNQNPTEKPDIRYSRDTDYVEAVNSGDMDTAQRMVDEAAKDAGYSEEMFHGSHNRFNSFDPDRMKFGNSGYGYYFGDRYRASEFTSFSDPEPIRVYVNPDRIARHDTRHITPGQFRQAVSRLGISAAKTYKQYGDSASEYIDSRDDDWKVAYDLQHWADYPKFYGKTASQARLKGSEILSILQETLGLDGMENEREFVLWDNRLVKSADPVTYDDQGNVIPLSERFNSENNDIRYSRDSDQDNKVKANFGTMFSGTGTVDFALRNVINHSFAVEYDNNISAVYRMNNGDEIYEGDVRDAVKQGYIDDKDVDFLHASPVCKDYSAQKQDATETPLDISTAKAVADVIDSKQPKLVTIENVRGYKNSQAVKLIQDALDRNGYVWDEGTYKASDFGGATIRERYFIRAARDVDELPAIPEKKQAKSWYDATKDLIPDLKEMPLKEDGYMASRWNELKDSIDTSHPVLLLRGTKGGKLVYAEYDKPSPTIIASETEARIVMPDGRFLEASPRVLARIQGLPDEFQLPKQKTLANKVVGNGVPVELTQAVLGSLLPVISGENYSDIRFSRDTTESEQTLRQQNRELKAQLKETTERYLHFKGELQLTKEKMGTPESARKLARQTLKDVGSKANLDDVTKGILDASKVFFNVKEIDDIEDVMNRMKQVLQPHAMQIINDSYGIINPEEAATRKAMQEFLKAGNGIIVTDKMKADVPDWASFRKASFGSLKLVSGAKTNIESIYADLRERFGANYFPEDVINESDMLQVISDVMSDLTAVYDNPYTYAGKNMAEEVEALANAMVLDVASQVKEKNPTFADKQKALREQIIKDLTAKKQQAVQRIREQRDDALKKQAERYKGRIKSIYNKRQQYEYRTKIRKKAKDLSTLLLRPTDKKHIPYNLQGVVLDVLNSINTGSKFDLDLDGNRVPLGKGIQTKKTSAYLRLKEQLTQLKNQLVVDPDLFDTEDSVGMLTILSGVGDTSIDAMDSEQLEAVYTVLRNVENIVRTYNKAFNQARFDTISEAAVALHDENAGKTGRPEYIDPIEKTLNLLTVDMLTPEAYFRRLGTTGSSLFKMLRNAQDKNIKILKEAQEYTEANGLYKLKLKNYEKDLLTVRLGNRDVNLSKAQLMELYVLNKREASRLHIQVGGIIPEPVQTKKSLKKNTYIEPVRNISQDDLARAFSQLSAEDIQIAERLQEFVSTVMTDYGNEASMKVYGYKKFGDENYWPIRVNEMDLRSELGAVRTRSRTVSNKGFTNALKPNANQSVSIGSIFDTFTEHVAEMANYSAFLDTMEDLKRIYNYTERGEGGAIDLSIKYDINNVFGNKGTKYFEKLMEDVSNGMISERSYFGGLIGRFKAAAVGSNLRVIVQQPTAIFRAMDMISPKYMAIGIAKFRQGAKKALENSPIAQWKDWGYFDINTGRSTKNILFENSDALDRVQSVLMAGAGKADSLAWGALYSAVEAEIKDTRADLDPRSKEFDRVVADRFADVIDHSQVVDGVLQRSGIMRSTNAIDKMATSFMGEPIKQFNMLATAIYDLKNASPETKKQAARTLGRSVAALAVAGVLNAAVQSIIDAMRDDDPEEKYWEKFLDKFTGDEATFAGFMSSNVGDLVNPLQYVPYAKDIVSIMQGYDVERMDISLVNDLYTDAKYMVNAFQGKGKYSMTNTIMNFLNTASKFFGLSIGNVKRDVAGIANTVAQGTGSYVFEYRMSKFTYNLNQSTNKGRFVEILAKAYKAGDRQAFNIILNDLIKEDKFATTTMTTREWIKKRLKEKHQISIN